MKDETRNALILLPGLAESLRTHPRSSAEFGYAMRSFTHYAHALARHVAEQHTLRPWEEAEEGVDVLWFHVDIGTQPFLGSRYEGNRIFEWATGRTVRARNVRGWLPIPEAIDP